MPYEAEPGAYGLILGPGGRAPSATTYKPGAIAATGWPREWPAATAEEATQFFEGRPLDMPERVTVGRVGKSHGLDGSFVVENASDAPERFAVGAELWSRASRRRWSRCGTHAGGP